MYLFRVGAQCGLTPNEVLDCSLDIFNACVQGYTDRLLDLQILAVHNGYWNRYYSSKHPKSLQHICSKLLGLRTKRKDNSSKQVQPDVDVQAFLETERKFNERLKEVGPIARR